MRHPALLLTLLAWLALLPACGGRAVPPTPRAAAPRATPAAIATMATTRHFGAGDVVASSEVAGLDAALLGAAQEPSGRLTVQLGLYFHGAGTLTLDVAQLLDGVRLAVGAEETSPDNIEVEQGNAESFIAHSGVVAHLTFAPPASETARLELPSFPPLALDLSRPLAAAPTPPVPLLQGLWRAGEPLVGNFDLPTVALQVVDFRVRGDEAAVRLGFVNLQEGIVSGAESSVRGAAVRLVDGRGLAWAPTEVDPALTESILPAGEWYPGEAHTGRLRFPRPTAGPLRLEVPGFPALLLHPAARPAVTLATAADLPPGSQAMMLPAPPALPNAALAAPVDYADIGRFLNEVGAAMTAGETEALPDYFDGAAREQADGWRAGLESVALREARFQLQRGGTQRGTHVTGSEWLLWFRLDGDSEANRFMLPVALDLERRDGRWRIVGWESDAPLWGSDWARSESGHFLILADPALAGEAEALSAEAERAWAQVVDALPTIAARDRYTMLVPATPARFRSLTERDHQTLGVATARYLVTERGVETNSLALVLNGAALAELPDDERQRTLAHELVHLRLAPVTRSLTPAWVAEGAATVWSEGVPWPTLRRWLAADGAAQLSLAELSTLDHFDNWRDAETVPVQYAYSAALVAFLVEQFGQDAFLAFYQDFASESSDATLRAALDTPDAEAQLPALRLALTETLVPTHFALDLAQLEADFERWLMREAAQP